MPRRETQVTSALPWAIGRHRRRWMGDRTKHPAAPSGHSAAVRLARTPVDMAKAVLVLLVPVAILVAVYVFFFGGSNVIAIDPSGTLRRRPRVGPLHGAGADRAVERMEADQLAVRRRYAVDAPGRLRRARRRRHPARRERQAGG